ncbi:30S ribosomal protein S1 [Saccharibacillus sp. CPCC 101409]|uniref:30S ribosomal protein S1 n=1 Tax=Saccharibacillus sp. CPCC 101409 TaxID=3058041 RepID=UPI00267127F1|nr:30S ribosomal protein S1 [Saccharibacillus sp. CPCC 101409]MDO3409594.1 30S ribosomal protein S1 [Saccharibacillus sp. CPCC 101409]
MSEETRNENQEEVVSQEVNEETVTQDQLDQAVAVKKGDTVTGTIVKLDDDQAYVSIGYKYDGTISSRELDEDAAVGQEVTAKVVSINDNKEQLILSKKAIDGDKAWDQLEEKFASKEIFEVKITDVVKGGIVADVGVRAFIPASMVERHFVEDFKDYKGRTIRVRVKELDRENNKVILSAKDVLEEEFEANKQQVMADLQEGQVIEGKVQRLTQFGAFVDVGGVDGLVHVSEMAWHHVDKPADAVSEGETVKVKVLKVDPEKGKISLSIKAATPGPWESASEKFSQGDVISGEVKRLVPFGAFVEIAPGVEGLVHISQISHKHIGTPQEVLQEGQTVQVKVLDVNPSEKRISLSIKETEEAPVGEARAERPERTDRPERSNKGGRGDKGPRVEKIDNPNVSLSNQGMNVSLGERFGDLSALKEKLGQSEE